MEFPQRTCIAGTNLRSAKQARPAPSAVRQPAARSELWAQKYHEQLVERVQSVDENQVCQREGLALIAPLVQYMLGFQVRCTCAKCCNRQHPADYCRVVKGIAVGCGPCTATMYTDVAYFQGTDIVLYGDSILHDYENTFSNIFDKYFNTKKQTATLLAVGGAPCRPAADAESWGCKLPLHCCRQLQGTLGS